MTTLFFLFDASKYTLLVMLGFRNIIRFVEGMERGIFLSPLFLFSASLVFNGTQSEGSRPHIIHTGERNTVMNNPETHLPGF